MVAITAGADDDDKAAQRDRPERGEHIPDRVGLVRIVDDDARAGTGIELTGHLGVHVESLTWHAGGTQDGRVQGIDRPFAVQLREAACLEDAAAIAQ